MSAMISRRLASLNAVYSITIALLALEGCCVAAVEFNMLFMTRCIQEEIPAKTQVELEYVSFDKQDSGRVVGMKVVVEDPSGRTLHEATADLANVTFKAEIDGDYKACFNVPSNIVASRVKLRVEWRLGYIPMDWDNVAKKTHVDEMSAYVDRFKEVTKILNTELTDISKKETRMREINEATNTRVAMMSLLCVAICVGLTCGQVWYLRRFFTKKKII